MRVGLPASTPDAAHYMLCRWVERVCSSSNEVETTDVALVDAARVETNTWLEGDRSTDWLTHGWKQRDARRLYGQLALHFNAMLDEERRHGLVLRLEGGSGQPYAVIKEAGPGEAYTLYTPKDALMKRYATLDALCAELGTPEHTMLYLPVRQVPVLTVAIKEEPPAPAPVRAKKPAATTAAAKKRQASTVPAVPSPAKKAAPEGGQQQPHLIEESSGETVK